MKSLEKQIEHLKNVYGSKVSPQLRQRLDKYELIFTELRKTPLSKAHGSSSVKMLTGLEEELENFKCEVEAEIKMELTDYEAFLWKLEHIKHEEKLNFLEEIKFQETKKEISLSSARKDWNFPILQLKTKNLVKISQEILMKNSYAKQNFDASVMSKMVKIIATKYNILSYHNFSHAFSLFLMFFQCTEASPSFKELFSHSTIFIGLISSLCHDMGHPGTNSGYEIKRKTEMAFRYQNESVLQNMHISQFHKMNKENPDIDIIGRIKNSTERSEAKKLLTRLILATDMMCHNKILNKMKGLKEKNMKNWNTEEKEIILENLFHACDIGNPALEFQNYMNWSYLVTYEFHQQACLEHEQKLEVTPNFMFKDMKTHYKGQIGFIDYVVFPLWKEISEFFPELNVLTQEIKANRAKLELKK